MVKSRFSISDVVASARELQASCVGWRVANVYDVSSRSFLFKLNESGVPEKKLLLVESGVRFHLTKFESQTGEMPSPICAKLRLVLKGKRFSEARVLGADRVVDLRFGAGANTSHLILELYAAGNVVLTDDKYVVLAALRSHQNFRDGATLTVGEPYPVASATCGLVEVSEAPPQWRALLDSAQTLRSYIETTTAEREAAAASSTVVSRKAKKAAKGGLKLATVLMDYETGFGRFGSDIVEHCLALSGMGADTTTRSLEEASLEALRSNLLKAPECFELARLGDGEKSAVVNGEASYVAFAPMGLKQHEGTKAAYFETFSLAVDEYFRVLAEAKAADQESGAQHSIMAKVEKMKLDQQQRVESLRLSEEERREEASRLESMAGEVDKVTEVLRGALDDSGMTWEEIEEYIAEEKRRGSKLASLIAGLDCAKREVKLDLNGDGKTTTVSVDCSAYASARQLWGSSKSAKAKAGKTEVAAATVIGKAERTAAAKLAAREMKQGASKKLRAKIAPPWFARHAFFVTSEGHLCIAPRDKGQAQKLVFDTMRSCDALVCAEAKNAPPCILRAKKSSEQQWTISPLALHEAGCFVACRSDAWTQRDRCATWWVHAGDIRRVTDPDAGNEVYMGDFTIATKATKHFLPPTMLELHFGLLFRLSDETQQAAHVGERADRVDAADLILVDPPIRKEAVVESKEAVESKREPMPKEEPIEQQPDEEEDDASSVATTEGKKAKQQPAPLKKRGKPKPRRRREYDDDDDDEDPIKKAMKKAELKRQQKKQDEAPPCTVEEELPPPPPPTTNTTVLLDGHAADALGRLGPSAQRAWAVALSELPAGFELSGMAFEVAELAKLPDNIAAEALEELARTERRLREADETARSHDEALARRGGIVHEKQNKKPHNVPAMLLGIMRRIERQAAKGAAGPADETNVEEEVFDLDDDSAEIGAFTGLPRDGDEVAYVLPVCAPTASMRSFKHTLKLTPGTSKKGKAAKDALELLAREASAADRDHIRTVDQNDAINALVAGTKISSAKVTALKNARKVEDKLNKKQAKRGGPPP